jgi:hypothetical protein
MTDPSPIETPAATARFGPMTTDSRTRFQSVIRHEKVRHPPSVRSIAQFNWPGPWQPLLCPIRCLVMSPTYALAQARRLFFLFFADSNVHDCGFDRVHQACYNASMHK